MEKLAGMVMLSWGWRRALLAMASGAVGVLALAPIGFFAAMFVSFTLLVWLLDGASGNPARGFIGRLWPSFVIGWCFGFGYFVAGLWWLCNALLVDGTTYLWALPLAIFGLPAYLALFYGLAGVIARIFWSDGFSRIAALALAFGAAEWLRSFVLTGFPWNAIGYAAMPVPLMMQSVHVVGVYGMNALAVLVFAAPALIATRKGMLPGLVLAGGLFIAHIGYGAWVLSIPAEEAGAKALHARLVQPISPLGDELSDHEKSKIFEDLLKMSSAAPQNGSPVPDLIFWPETAIPFILTENQDALTGIGDMLQPNQVLLSGAVREELGAPGYPARYYNSIYAFDDRAQIVGAADKVHLVPFGEYLPFEDLVNSWGIKAIATVAGGFSASQNHVLFQLPNGLKLYPLICYEAIFPAEISDEAESADALLNVTNDTWFGDSPGPWQHFHQAQVTAVESGLPLIRVANNGISAVVDARGNIVSSIPFGQKTEVDTTLPIKPVSFWTSAERRRNFSFIMLLIFMIVTFSRVGFISRAN